MPQRLAVELVLLLIAAVLAAVGAALIERIVLGIGAVSALIGTGMRLHDRAVSRANQI